MNLALWIISGVLAFAFAGSGILKLVQSKDKLVASGTGGWAADWSPTSIKLIGAAEILGAIGLILPAVLHVAPVLVPLAAVGLILVIWATRDAGRGGRARPAPRAAQCRSHHRVADTGRRRGMGSLRAIPFWLLTGGALPRCFTVSCGRLPLY